MHQYMTGSVGERIQDLLKEKRQTQAWLAEKADISKATLSRYISDSDSRIPHDALLRLSKALGVSTDFLLGVTDIPYRTNFDIEELGLTANAAAKLYTGEADPHIVSQMLENPYFAVVLNEIAAFVQGTESASMATYNQYYAIMGKLLQKQGKINPQDKRVAKQALQEVKACMVPPALPEMIMIRAAFERFLEDLRRQGQDHIEEHQKLTSSVMQNMIAKLEKRKNTFDLQEVTKKDVADAITEALTSAGYSEEEAKPLRAAMEGMMMK